MAVFNYLVPALFLNIPVGNGNLSTGGSLVLGHITGGTLVSESNFETQINASVLYTNDFPSVDSDGLHDRPNLRGLIATDDKEYLQIDATGIQTLTPELDAITTGTGTGDLPFGTTQSVFVVSFRTGAQKYKNLEDSIFVGSETVKSLDSGSFRAGIKISKLYSTKTNITLD